MVTNGPLQDAVSATYRARARSVIGLILTALVIQCGCAQESGTLADSQIPEGGQAPEVIYDTTAAKPVEPRDRYERWVYERWGDLKLVDKLMDHKTRVPAFDRDPLPRIPVEAHIAEGVAVLNDIDPFPEPVPLPPKEVTIQVAIASSTFRTREKAEVLSAIQPFIDLVQREVNIRGAAALYDTAEEVHLGLLNGDQQMVISHVFDYLLVRSWFAELEDNGTVLLGWAQPAHPRTNDLEGDVQGVPGTAIELVVARNSAYQTTADLKGARLALAANYVHAPGTFLTKMLVDLRHDLDQPFFSQVELRRYPKDAVIDVLKGKADVACVDQGTTGALLRFYGIEGRVRTLAISPRYNLDVLYTSLNNLAERRTEVELTQRQLTTLDKDPEGQEVLFFFDVEAWYNYREGDIVTPRRHFIDYLTFLDTTPVDLRRLLDAQAEVDHRTYDRFGDE